MNGPEAFLHMVCCEKVRNAGEFIEEFVFETEEGAWPNNCCFGEYAADYFFATSLYNYLEVHFAYEGKRLHLCSEEFGR